MIRTEERKLSRAERTGQRFWYYRDAAIACPYLINDYVVMVCSVKFGILCVMSIENLSLVRPQSPKPYTYFSQDSATHPSSLVELDSGRLAMSGVSAASNSAGTMPILSAWNSSWVSFLSPRYITGISSPPYSFHSFTGTMFMEDSLGNVLTSGGVFVNGGALNTGAALTKDSSGGADLGPTGTISGINRAAALLDGSQTPRIAVFGNGTDWLNSIQIDTSGNVSNVNGILLPSTLAGYQGTSGSKVQLSDGTGTNSTGIGFASDGSITAVSAFSGTKTVGSCTFTIVNGLIMAISGC